MKTNTLPKYRHEEEAGIHKTTHSSNTNHNSSYTASKRRKKRDPYLQKLAFSSFLLCLALLIITALFFPSETYNHSNPYTIQQEEEQQERSLSSHVTNKQEYDFAKASCDLLYQNTDPNNKEEQCAYAKQCNENDGVFLPVVFCSTKYSTTTLCLLLALPLLLLLLTLFRLIVSTAEDFFSPPLEMFSVELGLPHRFAGVTLLALGNGAPDVSATVNAMLDDHHYGYQFSLGELTGSGMFISSVIVGAVVLTSTSECGVSCGAALMRDVIVFFVSHLVVFVQLSTGVVRTGTIVVFLVLYFSYVLVVLAADLFHGRVLQPRLDELMKDQTLNCGWGGGGVIDAAGSKEIEEEDDEKDNGDAPSVDKILGLGKMKKKPILEVPKEEKDDVNSLIENYENEENKNHRTETKKGGILLCDIERKPSSNLTIEEPITHNQFENIMELLSNYSDVQYQHYHHHHHTHHHHQYHHAHSHSPHYTSQQQPTAILPSLSLDDGTAGSAAAMTTASTTSSTSGWAIEDEYGTEHIAVYHGAHSLIHVNRASHHRQHASRVAATGVQSEPTSPYQTAMTTRRYDPIPEVASIETTSESSALLSKHPSQNNKTPDNISIPMPNLGDNDGGVVVEVDHIDTTTTLKGGTPLPPSTWKEAWEQNISDLMTHFKSVWNDIYNNEENNWFEKVLLTCELPFTIFRMMTTPIPCGGYYCRCLVAISTILSPLWITVYVWDQDDVNFYNMSSDDDVDGGWMKGINPAIIFTVVSVVVGLAVFRYAPGGDGPMPLYFSAPLALYGFIVAATWIDAIADYLVSLLSFIGIICHIPSTIMGLTVLAVGNSMGDLSANVTMSRKGLANMAVTACFAGPVFNILIGLGLGFSMLKKIMGKEEIRVELTSTLNVGFIFLIINCVLVMAFGLIFGRGGRIPRGFGYLALTVYTAYVIASLAV